jgi:hypothetical protein
MVVVVVSDSEDDGHGDVVWVHSREEEEVTIIGVSMLLGEM